jgi:hypothetical protein
MRGDGVVGLHGTQEGQGVDVGLDASGKVQKVDTTQA